MQSMTLTVPAYMVGRRQRRSRRRRLDAPWAPISRMTGDANASTSYAAQDLVATLLTQLGLMPQLMNIKLTSSVYSPTAPPPAVTFTITANLRPFATTPPLAPAAPTITMGGGQ